MTTTPEDDDAMPPVSNSTGQNSGAPPGEINAKVQDAIGRALKAHYDDLVGAPVPDRFLVLLAELEAKEKRDDGETS